MRSGTQPIHGRQAGGRALSRLRACAAIAIFAGAACLDDAASVKAGETASPPAAPAAATVKVGIVPLDAARSADAAIFSTYLAQETSRGGALPLVIGGALGAGEEGGGTYLVAVIDIADMTGKPLHRLVSETTVSGGAVDERVLRRFAAETAGRIAQWYGAVSPGPAPGLASTSATNDAIVTGSTDAPAPPAFTISVGPAPGDGASALTRALDAELKARAENAPWLTAQNIVIEGSIATASRSDGRTDVSIHWLIKSADGQRLGEIHQKNALAAARIAGRWGEVAETAARAAADGVVAVLQPAPERLAANG